MKYICEECKTIFDDVDSPICPECGNDLVDALMCPECGELVPHLYGHGNNLLCDECIQKVATIKNVIRWCYDDKQSIEINCALIALLSASEIETILTEYLNTDPKSPSMNNRIEQRKTEFLEENKDEFGEYASKEDL